MKRREFLIGSASITGSVLLATIGCGPTQTVTLEVDLEPLLPIEAEPLGAAWRKLASADADPAAALFDDLKARGVVLQDPASLHAGLRDAIRDDFGRRRTVEVRGWVLSLTECRLFALIR